ncbi:MAG: uracil-DNA glycosylase family protein, partial [Chloroflexota bacterium]
MTISPGAAAPLPSSPSLYNSLGEVASAIRDCQGCSLCHGRKLAVPGEGPSRCDLMLIGEGPGFNENEQGRPFVGAAGKFLEQLLASIQLTRGDVYITNVVKCRPPNNRDPQPDEIAACATYLERQLDLVQPRVVVTLGRFSMARWFPGQSISRIHGQAQQFGQVWVFPCFHPAAALHQERYKALIEEDFLKLPAVMARATPPPP